MARVHHGAIKPGSARSEVNTVVESSPGTLGHVSVATMASRKGFRAIEVGTAVGKNPHPAEIPS